MSSRASLSGIPDAGLSSARRAPIAPARGRAESDATQAAQAWSAGAQRSPRSGKANPARATPTAPLSNGGERKPLPATTRNRFERYFGKSLLDVRIHDGPKTARTARSLGARAFTIGTEIGFDAGQYDPASARGSGLLAHELTHAVHHNDGRLHLDRYAPGERTDMAAGTAVTTALDTGMAMEQGFQPGDIVFRLGSANLALLSGESVTHGGAYLGNGQVHDMVGFGNRTVSVSNFYLEADDPGTIRIVRFTGPHASLIIQRVLANIRNGDFRLPSDPVPWNLFSTATNYDTATCLEYTHAQFLHAINRLVGDPSVPAGTRSSLRGTYFAGGSAAADLITPKTIRSHVGQFSVPTLLRMGAVFAADMLAEDVDPAVFDNRWEGVTNRLRIGTQSFQQEELTTFTYSSFVNAAQFFTDVTPPAITATTTPHSQSVVTTGSLGDDDDVRSWASTTPASTIALLPAAEKVRLIELLLEGSVHGTDVAAAATILNSVQSRAELALLDARLGSSIDALRATARQILRNALARTPPNP